MKIKFEGIYELPDKDVPDDSGTIDNGPELDDIYDNLKLDWKIIDNETDEDTLKIKKLEILSTILYKYIDIHSNWINRWGNTNTSLQKKIDELLIDIKEFK